MEKDIHGPQRMNLRSCSERAQIYSGFGKEKHMKIDYYNWSHIPFGGPLK